MTSSSRSSLREGFVVVQDDLELSDLELSPEDKKALREMSERPTGPTGSPEDDQLNFFEFWMWLLVLGPVILLLVLGAARKKGRPRQLAEEVTEDEFIDRVMAAEEPVLVHFHDPWHVGDQINIAQVEKLALRSEGRFRVATIDVEANPAVLAMYDDFEAPALMLFIDGERVYHCEGLFDEVDVYEEVVATIRRLRPGWVRDLPATTSDAENG